MRHIAFASTALLLVAAPAFARGPDYRAELARPAPSERFIVRDVLWNCAGADCTASENGSRPAIDCVALARQAGALRSFSVGGQALPADQLEKCNVKAK